MAPTAAAQKFFEVTVHQDNIKAFSTALHLLLKVGKEMTLGKVPRSDIILSASSPVYFIVNRN
jgi:ferredoxin-NADP reductase